MILKIWKNQVYKKNIKYFIYHDIDNIKWILKSYSKNDIYKLLFTIITLLLKIKGAGKNRN